ncbi:MAG: UPF0158 family protein [Deferrisomatales bacterium]|nr:UPF0158 family protein [Deferrisomatales bacterium]
MDCPSTSPSSPWHWKATTRDWSGSSTGKTGEVFPVTEGIREEDEALAEALEEGSDRYLLIEPRPSSEGYRLMAEFAASVIEPLVRQLLEAALRGTKPFRRFKDALAA